MSGDEWSGERVRRWLAASERLEGQLAPVADLLLDAAAIQPGEHVLDVGCGHGPTTRRAALDAAPGGRVVGLDVSAEMIGAAAAIEPPAGAAPIEWVAADATTWRADPVDVVISRFGVMFFEHPVAAFANLAASTRPDGRLCVAVWGHRHGCPLFEVPLAAAMEVLADLGHDTPPVPAPDEGPFSLHDRDRVVGLLSAAGWTDVTWTPHVLALPLGGGGPAPQAAESTLDVGPVRVISEGIDDADRARLVEAIAAAVAPHEIEGRVLLDAEVALVAARRPG
ncbi:class I SAM-dependent methyltransferase [Actinomarinicola tropica]|uniref:class I SAM-dependent methyltransferase n=1 Tax=Actinomarinicola tropica TaxID=2789776 RepID=UPI001897DE32|nr:class I SAM-dependent methyltransferase [Actinomarinicola tropica]